MSDDAAARALFAEYKATGLAKIEDDLTNHAEEGENLEFKQSASKEKDFERADNQNLSIAISAFANTSGGVLVWGLKCARDSEDIDRVSEKVPIKSLNWFRAKVKSLLPTIVQPGLNGIELFPIETAKDSDEGYLVMFIPASQGEPVRAAAKGTQTYHLRISDTTPVMPHSTLADRFGRRPHPKLELRWWRSGYGTTAGRTTSVTLTLAICNIGLGIAKYPAARLQRIAALKIQSLENKYMVVDQSVQLTPVGSAIEHTWNAKPGVVVQSGIHLEITTVQINIPGDATSVDFEMPYTLLCEGDYHEGVMKGATGQISEGVIYKDERKDDPPILDADD